MSYVPTYHAITPHPQAAAVLSACQAQAPVCATRSAAVVRGRSVADRVRAEMGLSCRDLRIRITA